MTTHGDEDFIGAVVSHFLQSSTPLRWRRASREAAYVECCGHAVVQEATLSQLRWGGECLGGRVGRDGWLLVGLWGVKGGVFCLPLLRCLIQHVMKVKNYQIPRSRCETCKVSLARFPQIFIGFPTFQRFHPKGMVPRQKKYLAIPGQVERLFPRMCL